MYIIYLILLAMIAWMIICCGSEHQIICCAMSVFFKIACCVILAVNDTWQMVGIFTESLLKIL